jgi:cold shock CspA family protein
MISLYWLSGKIPYFVTETEILGDEPGVSVIFGDCFLENPKGRLGSHIFLHLPDGDEAVMERMRERLSKHLDSFDVKKVEFERAGIIKSCGEKYGFIKEDDEKEWYFLVADIQRYSTKELSRGDFVYFNISDDDAVQDVLVVPGNHKGLIIGKTKSGHAIVKHLISGKTFIHKIRPDEHIGPESYNVLFTPGLYIDKSKNKSTFVCTIKEFLVEGEKISSERGEGL